MKRWITIASLAVGLFGTRHASALDPGLRPDQYVLRAWSTDEGLPQKDVFGFAQTPDDYMWLATEEGLARFDGDRFVVFDATTAALPSSDVQGVCLDGRGSLWIATRGGGLVRREKEEFHVYGKAEGLSDLIVGHVACTEDGAWASTPHGVFRVDAAGVHAIGKTPAWSDVDAMQPVADGAWIATRDGLFRIQGHAVVDAGWPAMPTTNVTALLADGAALWLGGPGWLGKLEGAHLQTWPAASGFSKGTPRSILRDRNGALWVACEEDGLYRLALDGRSFDHFGVHEGLPDTELRALFEDHQGNLWVGTTGHGVLRFADPKIVTLGKRDGITGDTVWSVYAARNGDVWVGTRNGGLDLIPPHGPVEHFSKQDGLPSDTVYGISEAPDGSMWFGTKAGAAHFVGGRFEVHTRATGLPHDIVHSTYVARDGVVWLGTTGGVTRLRDGVLWPLEPAQGMPEAQVLEIDGDADGSVWIGTDGGGLVHVVGDRLDVLTKARGLADDSVHSVTSDPDGTLWVATFHGLTRIRGGEMVNATTREGLCDDVVFSALPGPEDSIWLATNNGVMRFSRAAFERYATRRSARIEGVTVYGKPDGLADAECNGGMPTGTRDTLGRLWFANLGGVLRVDPARVAVRKDEPRVVVESVATKDASLPARDDTFLRAGTREVTFRYTSPSFTTPERLRFRYRLGGYDSAWVEAGNRREAYFTNLAPGSYLFEVAAARSDGSWGAATTPLRIRIDAHPWQTTWFLGCIGLAVAGAGVGLWRLRVRALRARAEELSRRVDERTRELAERDAHIRSDLGRARAFQQRTLPVLPTVRGLSFAAEYAPADEVGGDVYDVFCLEERTYRIFLADMTGHGIPAALRTMVLRTEYEVLKRKCEDPSGVLAALSTRIHDVYPDLQMRCSAVCVDVTVDAQGGASVVYANALHPPLLVARRDGTVEEVYEPGAYVGMLREYKPALRRFTLRPGEVLVLLTDGIYERPDEPNPDSGFDAILECLRTGSRDAAALARTIAAMAPAGSGSKVDDRTVFCVAACDPTTTNEDG